MNKPDPIDPSKYTVQTGEEVTIRVVSIGVAPLVKAALDGQTLPGPPFKFTVTKPAGALHIVSIECDFPPHTPAGLQRVKFEIYVKGSRGGPEYMVTTIYADTPIKSIDLKFIVI
jgi:hypothetical protein